MTKHETVSGEIRMAFDLMRYIMENPSLLEEIPDKALVDVTSADRPPIPTPEGARVVTFTVRRVFRRPGEAA